MYRIIRTNETSVKYPNRESGAYKTVVFADGSIIAEHLGLEATKTHCAKIRKHHKETMFAAYDMRTGGVGIVEV